MKGLKTFFIALDDENERIDFMTSWLAKSGLTDWVRSPGVFVKSPADVDGYDESSRLARYGYPMSNSEMGCFLAHRKCWEYAVSRENFVLILESDVIFSGQAELTQILDSILNKTVCWDLVRLHGIFEKNEKLSRTLTKLNDGYVLKQTLGDPMGAGAYLVSPSGAEKLLSASVSFFQPVDVFLAESWRHRARFRAVKPYPFAVRKFASVIGHRARPKQSTLERLSIEGHRFVDDLCRLAYLPIAFLRR